MKSGFTSFTPVSAYQCGVAATPLIGFPGICHTDEYTRSGKDPEVCLSSDGIREIDILIQLDAGSVPRYPGS